MKGAWIYLINIASSFWKMPSFMGGDTKESNDAKLRVLQMKSKGKKKFPKYKGQSK